MQFEDLLGKDFAAPGQKITLKEYLDAWSSEPGMKANGAGRILMAAGKPEVIDTSKDPRLGRIYSGRTIRLHPRFSDFFGVVDQIDEIMRYLENNADGLQHAQKILYVHGPVGSGKTTLVERLKQLAEEVPAWVLAIDNGTAEPTLSPVFESPLGIFSRVRDLRAFADTYKIPLSSLKAPMSKWAADCIKEHGGISKFVAVQVKPSMVTRALVARVTPGDEKTVDVRTLVGREIGDSLEYDYSGGLNRTTQGLLEIHEIFKASLKLMNPLREATTDHKYSGVGAVGELPYSGVVVGHSNSEEWKVFSSPKSPNASMLDRIYPVAFPYCLEATAEAKMYERYMQESGLTGVNVVPGTFEIPALFAVTTRVKFGDDIEYRTRLYDGQPIDDLRTFGMPHLNKTPTADELRTSVEEREGMSGISPRVLFTVLPDAARADNVELGLDPVGLYEFLGRYVKAQKVPDYNGKKPAELLNACVLPRLKTVVAHLIREAFVDSFDVFAREKFNLWFEYCDAWVEERDYKDEATGTVHGREWLDEQLMRMERGMDRQPDARSFRNHIIKAVLEHRGDPKKSEQPPWLAIEDHLWRQFEGNILPTKADMLPVIKYEKRDKAEDRQKHDEFVQRLCKRGCTERQARRLVEWYIQHVS